MKGKNTWIHSTKVNLVHRHCRWLKQVPSAPYITAVHGKQEMTVEQARCDYINRDHILLHQFIGKRNITGPINSWLAVSIINRSGIIKVPVTLPLISLVKNQHLKLWSGDHGYCQFVPKSLYQWCHWPGQNVKQLLQESAFFWLSLVKSKHGCTLSSSKLKQKITSFVLEKRI